MICKWLVSPHHCGHKNKAQRLYCKDQARVQGCVQGSASLCTGMHCGAVGWLSEVRLGHTYTWQTVWMVAYCSLFHLHLSARRKQRVGSARGKLMGVRGLLRFDCNNLNLLYLSFMGPKVVTVIQFTALDQVSTWCCRLAGLQHIVCTHWLHVVWIHRPQGIITNPLQRALVPYNSVLQNTV